MTTHGPFPGAVQEKLLIPPHGRAVEHRKEDAALRDERAAEIVAAPPCGSGRFGGLPSLVGTAPRTALSDRWTRDFLASHPSGTVLRTGTGPTTRYERVDNGGARWFELDLPDVIGVRRSSALSRRDKPPGPSDRGSKRRGRAIGHGPGALRLGQLLSSPRYFANFSRPSMLRGPLTPSL